MNTNTSSIFTLSFLPRDVLRNHVVGCFLAGCILMMLAGCASSGVVKNASTVTHAPITRDFVVLKTSSSVTNANPEIKLLNALIMSGLQDTHKFGHISDNTNAMNLTGGIMVNAEITELYKVSDSARMLVGGLAGRARILVQVTVSDLKSGNQIATFEVEGKSSGGTAFAGTTDQAIQQAAEQVVAEIVNISR
jgi:Domain of unknown function (DUF4410)